MIWLKRAMCLATASHSKFLSSAYPNVSRLTIATPNVCDSLTICVGFKLEPGFSRRAQDQRSAYILLSLNYGGLNGSASVCDLLT